MLGIIRDQPQNYSPKTEIKPKLSYLAECIYGQLS